MNLNFKRRSYLVSLSEIDVFDIDSTLGTPTSQQIIRFLSIWSELSIKEIQEKISLSETQIHNTLKNLTRIGVVIRIRRGTYSLNPSPFTENLKNAYVSNTTQIINRKIYDIKQKLKEKDIESANEEYDTIMLRYQPLLEERFSRMMHSLTHSFLEYHE